MICLIGEGSSCRFDNPSSKQALEAIKERNKFAVSSLNSINVNNIEFNNLPCGRFDQIPIIKINKIIEKTLLIFKPDIVFTHSPHDSNNDHKIVYNSTIIATRPGSKFRVNKLFSYEVLSSSEWNFENSFAPNYFEEISENDLNKKIKALEFYRSEIASFPFPRSGVGLETLAKYRGMQSGYKYAEAFRLIREFNK